MNEFECTGRLGLVISGSLTSGINVKLDAGASTEDLAVGLYVTISGEKKRFFGMVTDIGLETSDQRLLLNPPDVSDPLLAQAIRGIGVYGTLRVLPLLVMGAATGSGSPQPVKTVPAHFSPVCEASESDVEAVFGKEDKDRFWVGSPLDMETKVCLNLKEFVTRSNGIFGKSGTGKTFLTRILLSGMLQRSLAVSLVFDMHSEYGWEGTGEGTSRPKGLKQLFASRVAVFALDEENARRRKVNADYIVRIGYDEVEPEDIQILRSALNLTDASVQAVYMLARRFGRRWLTSVLQLQDGEQARQLAEELNIHEGTYRNLRRGLEVLRRFPFLVEKAANDSVRAILDFLEKKVNVVLEFGRFTDITAYILVANLLSRRIYGQYRERTERAMAEGADKPETLVITIEEAHRFLSPEVSGNTIFGTIAREMRKYNVTLLVVDQRPSGIDEEVMSQLGTKVCCLLDNEKDVDAVLSGVSGKSELRSVLAKLEAKQQALIFGHALPVPVVLRTREYGPEFYSSLAGNEKGGAHLDDLEKLWD
ncbi:MAG: ATP-binding protein [Chloroflexi bacterium]|nr:ATP-binding protein [Chloroflexota bacterium]